MTINYYTFYWLSGKKTVLTGVNPFHAVKSSGLEHLKFEDVELFFEGLNNEYYFDLSLDRPKWIKKGPVIEVHENVIKQLSELTALKVRQTQEIKFFITSTKVITITEKPIVTSIGLFHGGIEITSTGWDNEIFGDTSSNTFREQVNIVFRINYFELEETILKLKALAECRE